MKCPYCGESDQVGAQALNICRTCKRYMKVGGGGGWSPIGKVMWKSESSGCNRGTLTYNIDGVSLTDAEYFLYLKLQAIEKKIDNIGG